MELRLAPGRTKNDNPGKSIPRYGLAGDILWRLHRHTKNEVSMSTTSKSKAELTNTRTDIT